MSLLGRKPHSCQILGLMMRKTINVWQAFKHVTTVLKVGDNHFFNMKS